MGPDGLHYTLDNNSTRIFREKIIIKEEKMMKEEKKVREKKRKEKRMMLMKI